MRKKIKAKIVKKAPKVRPCKKEKLNITELVNAIQVVQKSLEVGDIKFCNYNSDLLRDLIINFLPSEPCKETECIWSDGESIYCTNKFECEVIANFLGDVFAEVSTTIIQTGYCDPCEEPFDGGIMKEAGYYFICFLR